jgi:DNA-binding transcriptional regulator YiaG
VKVELVGYGPGIDAKPHGRTDRDRVDKMADDEIEAAALSDPDGELTDEQRARSFRPARLVVLRRRLGLDQAAFASRFRIDLDTLTDWERGLCVSAGIARVCSRVGDRTRVAAAAALVNRAAAASEAGAPE